MDQNFKDSAKVIAGIAALVAGGYFLRPFFEGFVNLTWIVFLVVVLGVGLRAIFKRIFNR